MVGVIWTRQGPERCSSIASLVTTSAAVFALGAALAVVFLHLVGDDSGLERVWEMMRLGVRVG